MFSVLWSWPLISRSPLVIRLSSLINMSDQLLLSESEELDSIHSAKSPGLGKDPWLPFHKQTFAINY